MARTAIVVLVITTLTGGALAHPLNLSDIQLDGVSAGGEKLSDRNVPSAVIHTHPHPHPHKGKTQTATPALVGPSAQPLDLSNVQLDGVSAGGLNLSVLMAGISHVPSAATLPGQFSDPPAISQALNITIGVDPPGISIIGPFKP